MVNTAEIISLSAKARSHADRRYITHKRDETDANGVRTVMEKNLYVLDDDSPKLELFQLKREFENARSTFSWTMGESLFRNFRNLVDSSNKALRKWDRLVDEVNARTVATFTVTQQEFMEEMLKPLKYDSQLDCI